MFGDEGYSWQMGSPGGQGSQGLSGFSTSGADTGGERDTSVDTGEYYDWEVDNYEGTAIYASGSEKTLDGAKAKAKGAATNYDRWFIVIRKAGATVYTEGSDTSAGQGGSAGGQGGTGGGSSEGGEGYGEKGAVLFRYRLVGHRITKWIKPSEDPRTWSAESEDYDIEVSNYDYTAPDDALNAGKEKGDANPKVIWVYAEANMPGFAGKFYQYNDRAEAAWNEAGRISDEAYKEYKKTREPEPPAPPKPPGITLPPSDTVADAAGAIVAVIAVVTIGALLYAAWRGAT